MERIKVISVTPLTGMRLLVIFSNHVVKLFDVRQIVPEYPEYADLENEDIFSLAQVESGGYGVFWTPDLDASEGELWENGVEIPLSAGDLTLFIRENILNTTEAAEILSCSRQNVDDLIRRKKLNPIKMYPKGNIFLKSDVIGKISEQT
jgi:hypothetical protein